jgi:hypothetical protein
MQPLKARMVLFGALVGLACHGDPTGNEGTPTSIVAQPKVVFVPAGTTQPVLVTVVDEDGQSLQADFTLSDIGPGITVEPDPTFLGVTSGNQIRRQARFFVTGNDLTATTFVVSALGLSETIQVTSVPASLAATISDTVPALGDTISITAPAGTFFTESSQLTFEGALPFIVSQDASTIVFIPGPNTNAPAAVSEVGVTSNPDLTFNLATIDRVRTDSIVDIGANVTPTSPALGGSVTVTLPAGLRVIPESLPSVTVANAPVPSRDVTVSPDSATITFVPPPNADSFVVVPGVIPQRLAQCCTASRIFGTDTVPGYALTLPSTARVTTPVVTSLPSTLSSTTPAVNVPVILTSTDANFTFVEPAVVAVGVDSNTIVTGQTATTVSFLPPPGSTGVVGVGAVDVVGFGLPLPSTAPAITTSSTVPVMPGTGSPATAPVIAIPPAGSSGGFFDGGGVGGFAAATCGGNSGVPCQLYRFTLAADATFDVRGTWSNQADIGLYFLTADGTADTDQACDAHGRGADAQPEACTITLVAGTYLLGVVNFGPFYPENDPNPDWIGLAFSTPAP